MGEAPIENEVEQLRLRVAQLEETFNGFKMFQQRRATEIRTESKAYGAATIEKLDELQDQMNDRFENVHARLDEVHSGITTILQHLRPPSGS